MTSGAGPPKARPAVEDLAPYRPGRSASQAAADYGAVGAVKLASNELPFEPLAHVQKTLAAALAEANRYPDHLAGELRERLGELHHTSPRHVAVGCGTVGLLQQLALSYLDPGDEVVFADPSFEAYPIFTHLLGATPRPVPLRRLTHDATALTEAVTERTRLVFVAQPNNPTGTAMAASDLRRLVGAVPSSCLVVVDEAYVEFSRGRHLAPATALLDGRHNLVVLRTFSKAHGLAGLRVGYALGAEEVVTALDKVLIPFSVNRLGQLAALSSLDAPDELAERVAAVCERRTRLLAGLREEGWSVPDSEANFAFLPAGDASAELAVALERRGLVTRPFPRTGVRVTVGTDADVERFLETFSALAAGELAAPLEEAWGLPSGEAGRTTAAWLGRLEAADGRLAVMAASGHRLGLTEPDPGGEERWDDGQVWAHLVECSTYWCDELEKLLDAADEGPVPFGRTKSDPVRLAAVAAGRGRLREDRFAAVAAAIDRLHAIVSSMTPADWSRRGAHETLGTMDVQAILERFLIGHLEEHAAQLERLDG